MSIHDQIVSAYASYMKEHESVTKGVKIAGTRSRKALMDLIKLSKERRKEIIEAVKK